MSTKNIERIYCSGYIIFELLMAASVIITICSLIYIPLKAMLNIQHQLQLETAALNLAADLRVLQQQALFDELPINRFIIFANKKGYILEANNRLTQKRVDFRSNGYEEVYFSKSIPGTLRFTSNGAPSEAGEYILKHEQNSKLSKRIIIQVASGRVDVE